MALDRCAGRSQCVRGLRARGRRGDSRVRVRGRAAARRAGPRAVARGGGRRGQGRDRQGGAPRPGRPGRLALERRAAGPSRTGGPRSLALEGAAPLRQGIAQERLGRALWYNGEAVAALEAHEHAIALIPEEPADARAGAGARGLRADPDAPRPLARGDGGAHAGGRARAADRRASGRGARAQHARGLSRGGGAGGGRVRVARGGARHRPRARPPGRHRAAPT